MMSLEIQVGTPQLVIHQGETVWLAGPDGQLTADAERGLFFRDTRLISVWQLAANGAPWELLNGGVTSHFAMQVFMTNPAIPTQDGEVARRTMSLTLGRWIEDGIHEDITITNHGPVRACFNLELMIRSDFADLFEVKSGRLVRRGRITTDWSDGAQVLTSDYRNADFRRGLTMRVRSGSPAVYANGRVSFDVDLSPGASWTACLATDLHDGEEVMRAPAACTHDSDHSKAAADLADWRGNTLKLSTTNEEFYRLYRQAVDDLAALRLPLARAGHIDLMPAAGLPWFAALFGRDSLIVALQTAPLSLAFARGALNVLAKWQATERDDARDAEPGKILHELRLGELAHFKLIPHTPYYGTADATPLYLMHAARRLALPPAIWIVAARSICRDGRGVALRLDRRMTATATATCLQEYQTRSPVGYENMAWKDAGDSMTLPGRQLRCVVRRRCASCKAMSTMPGLRMAQVFDALGKPERGQQPCARQGGGAVRASSTKAFWDEDSGFYAYRAGRREDASVMSRCLQCQATCCGRALCRRLTVPPGWWLRLMAPDMNSGWGIRTLSAASIPAL